MVQPSKSQRGSSPSGVPTPGAPVSRKAWLMLALATVGFAVNFWAWALLSPLGPRFKDGLDLSSFETTVGDSGTNNNDFAVAATLLSQSGCTGVIGGGNGTGQSTPQASSGFNPEGQSCGGGTTVPDGGATLSLLGLSMVGLAYLRRRTIS